MNTTIDRLINKTFNKVENNDDIELIFSGDNSYMFYHNQNCCEYVRIEEIHGDLKDLENTPTIKAEQVKIEKGEHGYDHYTATFYKFSTIKGSVTVRWLGESNGYYSEEVDFKEINE